ncbi:conserved hypothetical protein [Tenacibaculum maritimum]|uniref:hypothetical protein n=1 Tax=Tenacibaculum maritimum TaxID=107401 RepID=UPI0012E483A4|nr:hypothetical protein [Tenacibaculum maritimum]CAA0202216.1 conserved hypothetical protein [Tenacibaculum maritimum]CAA0229639.1 conserved hypothetical protein [Tenacibaculum maritimum]CAA0230579.1 conserved hypothetical protein [Tenacibaculum maritimum]
MKRLFFVLVFFLGLTIKAQGKLPYFEIPAPPREYTAGAVAGRMVDGLGFRYYWATEGLKQEDLEYQPSKEARNTRSTLEHILNLSIVTLSSVSKEKMDIPKKGSLSFHKLRKKTLENFKKTSEILKESKEISSMVMKRGDKEYPFWNQLNGPIADAIWHVGQVVTFRRSSGNPLPKGVNLLTGKVKR